MTKTVIIIVSPDELSQYDEGRRLLPDEQEKGWRKKMWEYMRMDIGPRRRDIYDLSDLFSSTNHFSGSRRKEDSVCASFNNRTDQAYLSRRSNTYKSSPKPTLPPKTTHKEHSHISNKRKCEEV